MAQSRTNTSAPGTSLARFFLDGAMTAAAMHVNAWRVWHSWSELTVRQLTGTARTESGSCLRRRDPNHVEATSATRTTAQGGRFEILDDGNGVARFRLVTADGEAILTSREYPDAKSARSGMQSFVKNAVRPERYRRQTDTTGDSFFEVRAGNNRVLWSSAPYDNAKALEADLERLLSTARAATAAERERPAP